VRRALGDVIPPPKLRGRHPDHGGVRSKDGNVRVDVDGDLRGRSARDGRMKGVLSNLSNSSAAG
jgi:hypothetical protein